MSDVPATDSVELIKALCALMEAQLLLKPRHAVIYNQKYDIPADDGLYLYIAFERSVPYASSRKEENVPATATADAYLQEVQTMNAREYYTINLYSRDGSARQRNHEVIFALHSNQCEQLQERFSFKMGYMPMSMNDISHAEGAARINRYQLTFSLLRAYTRTRPIEYYSTFTIPPTLTIES